MKAGLELRLGQSLAMTPQLQQSIRLLQLSTLELSLEIQQALDSNPLLEVAEDEREEDEATEATTAEEQDPGAQAGEELLEDRKDKSADEDLVVDSSWDDYYESDGSTALSASAPGEDYDPFATQSTGEDNLRDHLLSQVHLASLSDTDRRIATALIESLELSGYLEEPLDEIVAMLAEDLPGIDTEEVEATLHYIQQLDPVGVAARSLAECLTIQIDQHHADDPAADDARALLQDDWLEAIARRELPQVIKGLGISRERLEAALRLIQVLDPRPGLSIGDTAADYIKPDVIVTHREDGWHVDLNPEIAPRLRVNQTYASLIDRSSRGKDATYIRNHLQEARWFIKSLRSRNESLLNVAREIVRRQIEFFEQGEIAMKPLVLREIAETLELHESTVSRVTTNKYMLTPRGVFEFKYFFSSHVGTSDGGECSATAIRARIKKLVEEENPKKPLSDAKIATMLGDEGIDVARRTIAKYREAMGIASSTDRKRLI
ncbi:RNA polymerase factor sigma-54 [Guyparkeria halophila]|uniref:RNA polymerase sigma-54 factor n=1 Tax=Guyparkeria halophila TaxID=47960 RepID=A0A6I6CZC3_9GAMM|nr:RNA polymerase factor sigma-54 [Guyparkeria halophila]QGT79589.1 RNA polymerase factor sigma-54 [Guyparkeria halophila]